MIKREVRQDNPFCVPLYSLNIENIDILMLIFEILANFKNKIKSFAFYF